MYGKEQNLYGICTANNLTLVAKVYAAAHVRTHKCMDGPRMQENTSQSVHLVKKNLWGGMQTPLALKVQTAFHKSWISQCNSTLDRILDSPVAWLYLKICQNLQNYGHPERKLKVEDWQRCHSTSNIGVDYV